MTLQLLLIDDNAALLRHLTRYLEQQGYSVIAVPDAVEAWSALLVNPIALIVTDVGLPGTNGLEFLARMRGVHPGLPAVVISADGSWANQRRAQAAGAVAFLAKPFPMAQLKQVLEGLVGPRDRRFSGA